MKFHRMPRDARNARVMVENKVARFYGSRCISLRQT